MRNPSEADSDITTFFNIGLHKLSKGQLLDKIIRLAGKGKSVIAYANIKTMNLALDEGWYHDFLTSADLVYCDGFGVILGARLAGLRISGHHRATCPDWLEELAGKCAEKGRSLFLLAGNSQSTNTAAAVCSPRVAGIS